jgi:ABC-type polysaccharide/polyol phosphate transport system ATPase subunit
MSVSVEVADVSKRFRLYRQKPTSLKERMVKAGRNAYDDFWALRDVSFDVLEGQTVGLLGHNGSGKSTLLECVAGTLRPASDHIRTRGRVAALLELGAGFPGRGGRRWRRLRLRPDPPPSPRPPSRDRGRRRPRRCRTR